MNELVMWWDPAINVPIVVRVVGESGGGHVLAQTAAGRVLRVRRSELDRVAAGPRTSGQLVIEGVEG